MEYGVLVPNWAPFDQDTMIRVGLEAEELGFSHLLYTDHLMNPHTISDGFPDLTVEAWSLISYIGAKTSRIRIGPGISPLALRAPALLAKQIATVDNLLDGRLDVGLGTGWAPGSFGLMGRELGSAKERLGRFSEGLELMRRLWLDDVVEFDGEYYKAHSATVAPKPLQHPYPPLYMGGIGLRMLELTAKFGNGWIPWHRPVDEYRENWERIQTMARSFGRADEVAAGSAVMVVADKLRDVVMDMGQGAPPNLIVSNVEEVVASYEQAGCRLFIFFLFPAEGAVGTMREIARRVL
jgi:alkanesulfonate monooxygenase SsuD/methylene tetrahydromethanopterin reductase-like flavin-dependent oxidoreductase (luciferase family)